RTIPAPRLEATKLSAVSLRLYQRANDRAQGSSSRPLRADERLDLGVGLGLPTAAVEHAIMSDFELEVVQLFRRRDAGAEIVRGDGLADRANVVILALDGHQRGLLDRLRLDRVAMHPEMPEWQVMVVKDALDGLQ